MHANLARGLCKYLWLLSRLQPLTYLTAHFCTQPAHPHSCIHTHLLLYRKCYYNSCWQKCLHSFPISTQLLLSVCSLSTFVWSDHSVPFPIEMSLLYSVFDSARLTSWLNFFELGNNPFFLAPSPTINLVSSQEEFIY